MGGILDLGYTKATEYTWCQGDWDICRGFESRFTDCTIAVGDGNMATSGRLLDKALASVGGKREFERKHRQYSESLAYLDAVTPELLKKYDNQWVAAFNSTVVAHAPTYGELATEIEHRGLPIGELVIKFLTTRKVITLF